MTSPEVLVAVMMQGKRQRIIQLLRNSKEPLWIGQIAKKIGETHRLTSFHLATLAEYGLVDGEYREIRKASPHLLGKAAKFYQLTPLAEKTIMSLKKQFESEV